MSPILTTILGISFIFLCTTLGSAVVFFFPKKEISNKVSQIFTGFAAGIMLAASFFSLILPSLETEVTYMPIWLVVGISILLGALFLYGIDKIVPHFHVKENEEEGIQTRRLSKTSKMFLAVTIHNVPEGLSVGIAFGVALASLANGSPMGVMTSAFMLALGIGLQNIPEGAVVSLPVRSETGNKKKAFLFGMFSGAVEPIAAVAGLFLALSIQVIMPWALSFAAGCMIYVVAEEMIPDLKDNNFSHYGVFSFIFGFILMMILDIALG